CLRIDLLRRAFRRSRSQFPENALGMGSLANCDCFLLFAGGSALLPRHHATSTGSVASRLSLHALAVSIRRVLAPLPAALHRYFRRDIESLRSSATDQDRATFARAISPRTSWRMPVVSLP